MLNKPSVAPLFIGDIHFVCGLKCLSVHRSSGTSRTGLCWRFAPGRVKTVWTRSTGAGWPTCTSPRTTLFWSLPAATSRYVYTQTSRLVRLLAVCIKFRDSKGSRRLSLVGRNKSVRKIYTVFVFFQCVVQQFKRGFVSDSLESCFTLSGFDPGNTESSRSWWPDGLRNVQDNLRCI